MQRSAKIRAENLMVIAMTTARTLKGGPDICTGMIRPIISMMQETRRWAKRAFRFVSSIVRLFRSFQSRVPGHSTGWIDRPAP